MRGFLRIFPFYSVLSRVSRKRSSCNKLQLQGYLWGYLSVRGLL